MRSFIAFVCLAACGGGAGATPTQPAPSSKGKPEQCQALASRIDAFSADATKVDMQQVQGLTSLQTLAAQASKDLSTLHADEPIASITSDSATHLDEASKVFGKLSQILAAIEAAKAKIGPDTVEGIETCVGAPLKTIATYCKAHPVADCGAVKSTIDAWGAADNKHQVEALAAIKALAVSDATVKPAYGQVVVCVQPLADALGEIAAQRGKLEGLADSEDAREKQLDDRFLAACGRKLFNNK